MSRALSFHAKRRFLDHLVFYRSTVFCFMPSLRRPKHPGAYPFQSPIPDAAWFSSFLLTIPVRLGARTLSPYRSDGRLLPLQLSVVPVVVRYGRSRAGKRSIQAANLTTPMSSKRAPASRSWDALVMRHSDGPLRQAVFVMSAHFRLKPATERNAGSCCAAHRGIHRSELTSLNNH
jgi:hypothetical protein